jgi:hypothetical protein
MTHDRLLERAQTKQLSQAEVDGLAQALLARSPSDPYTAIHALGHAGDSRYAAAVEGYLNWRQEPIVARMALQVLCSYWGLHDRYKGTIEYFLEGVDWDLEDGGYVQLAAAAAAGEYLQDHADDNLLRHLIALYRDDRAEPTLRDAAYASLVLATGGGWREVQSPTRAAVIDPDVLRKAESMLEGPGTTSDMS